MVLNREEAEFVSGGKREDLHDMFDHLHALGKITSLLPMAPDPAPTPLTAISASRCPSAQTRSPKSVRAPATPLRAPL